MEEKIIANYNEILNKFEKIINETKNEDLRIYIREQYVTFIVDLAKREGKELRFYEDKMRNIGIESGKIDDIIHEINKKINLYQTFNINNDNLDTNEEKKESAVSVSNEVEEYILYEVYRNKNAEIGDRHQKLSLKLQEDFKSPNELLIKTWVTNYMNFVNDYKEVLDRNKLIEYMRILFKKYDKEGIYYNNLDKYIEEVEKDKGEIETNFDKKDEKKEPEKKIDDLKTVEPLKIINIKKPTLSKGTKNIFKALGLLGVASTFGLPASILTFIIYKVYKKVKRPNKKLNDFINQNGYTVNEQDELIDKEGNVVTDEVIEKEKTSFLKTKLLNLKKTSNIGFIKDSYKKNKFVSMILDTKLVSSLKKRFNIDVNTKVLEKKNNEQKDMHNGLGKC